MPYLVTFWLFLQVLSEIIYEANTSSCLSFKVSFYIRREKYSKEYRIYCCLKLPEESPTEICVITGIKRGQLDLRKGRRRQASELLIKQSVLLDYIKVKLFDIYLELKLAKKDISVVRIKDMYLGKNEINRTILGVIDEAIEIYTEELAPGTINKYNATRIYVEMFS